MTKTTKGVRRPTREQLAERQREREARYAAMQKAHPAITTGVQTPAVAKAAKAAKAPKAAKPKSDRNVAPRPTSFSLLTRGVEHRDGKMDSMILNFKLGSRNLCKAILATGRTHGPMTEEGQIEAVRYAYNLM